MLHIDLYPVPVDESGAQRGCLMGPDALLTAGLLTSLEALGHTVRLAPPVPGPRTSRGQESRGHPRDLTAALAWVEAIQAIALGEGVAVFLGGNHLMSAGTIPLVARRAAATGRPLFVLWLDAHTDFHTLDTTTSGNLHGTPVAYVTGRAGFSPPFPPPPAVVDPERILMLGIRSVDPAERAAVVEAGIEIADMRRVDEEGVIAILRPFLARVAAEGGDLHVSFDLDYLDPAIAPGVGTNVPGGGTFREAHLVMELLSDTGLVTSLDIAELNPLLDNRGQTARLAVDLVASLFGKAVIDRKMRGF